MIDQNGIQIQPLNLSPGRVVHEDSHPLFTITSQYQPISPIGIQI